MYAPFWLFDTKASGMINGEATKVRTWTQGKYRYTHTMYYRVFRRGSAEYQRVPVDGSKKLDDKYMQMIEPYNYDDLTDFSMQYMSGFMAEKYDVESAEAETVMKERVEKYMEDTLKSTVNGYTTYTVSEKQIGISDTTQDYSMLPIYLLVNKFKGRDHVFIVNGQTGKVVGDTPVSRMKQLLFAGIVFALAWGAAVFGGALFV
jgi:hypothetical protein